MSGIYHSIKNWLSQYPFLYDNLKYIAVLLLAYVSYIITRKVFFKIIQKFTKKTKTSFDDILLNEKIIRYLSFVVPLYVIRKFSYLGESLSLFIELTASALIILFILLAVGNLITSVSEFYSKKEKFARQPIKGYAQVAKIILYIFGTLFIAGIFTGEKPWVILTGLGVLSAIILLIFKDTILSLVASIQIASNELFKIGDWIEMPSFGADGEVVDIALHTIRIQNWDMTYTLIPTYKFVENSFKNWKGMELSGSRRIKRNICIDMNTIKFISSGFASSLLSNSVIDESLKTQITDSISRIENNSTNLGLFLDYLELYIKNRPDIRPDLTLLVRTLQSTSEGLPVEVYTFCNKTNLMEYEKTQKEIFEHIFAVLPIFQLSVYQKPGGNDFHYAEGIIKKQ